MSAVIDGSGVAVDCRCLAWFPSLLFQQGRPEQSMQCHSCPLRSLTPNIYPLTLDPMRADQARTIPISDYLQSQGITPARTRMKGRELWYHSPIRDQDSTPSFKVDVILNLWYDHGLGKGGNTLDLAIELHCLSVRDALSHLEDTRLYAFCQQSQLPGSFALKPVPQNIPAIGEKTKAASADEKEKSCAFQLLDQKPLNHPALLQYLVKRKIDPQVAMRYASQIDFKAPQRAGSYFALAYPSGEGFEARNALFKGFVGIGKDITLHDVPGSDVLHVFEGFMDFFSYLTAKRLKEAQSSVLVLNSTALKSRALPHINDPRYRTIELYLDNDASGDEATAFFMERAACRDVLSDMRHHYAGHDDLNAWLMARQ